MSVILLYTPVMCVGSNVRLRLRYVKRDSRVRFIKVKLRTLGLITHESDMIDVGGYLVGEPVYLTIELKMVVTEIAPALIGTSTLHYVNAYASGAVYTTGQLNVTKGYLVLMARAEQETDVDIYVGGGAVPADTFRLLDIDGDGVASGAYVYQLTTDTTIELRAPVPFTALVASLITSPERDVDIIVEEYDENSKLLGYTFKTIRAVVAQIDYGKGVIESVSGGEVTE